MRRPSIRRFLRNRRTRKEALRGIRSDVALPFDMLDLEQNAKEARAAHKLAGIYHKGHRKGWDGQVVLQELLDKHGPIDLPEETREAMRGILGVILWGELAAWKVSAELALHIEPLEAKLAATSQTHDEARHFYTMVDYLELLDCVPRQLGPAATGILERTIQAPSLAQRLLGMQIMIEPLALTVFQLVRESRIEPILADLLALYERDEARHVALGVLHLPKLIRGMTFDEALGFWRWQLTELWSQFELMKEIQPHFETLGIDTTKVIEVGRRKQLLAIRMMTEELGYDVPIHDMFVRVVNARIAWDYPPAGRRRRRDRLEDAFDALWYDIDTANERLSNVMSA